MLHSSVTIQIAPESAPSTPSWLAEVAAFAQVLSYTGPVALASALMRALVALGAEMLCHFDVH